MLQQTQVPRVLDYYPRFLRRYPSVEALAAASPARVREAWDGLGYYARARNLHAAARAVVRERRGRFPRTREEAEGLPGVGRYTSGALLAFAFDEPVAALDTNGTRVLSRLFVARRSSSPSRTVARLEALAASLIPKGKGWAFNQALMDFGALVCTARSPRCGACPFRARCRAYARWQRGRLATRRSR
ncbi:MAG: A/G-specific adenine glycosylase [candidate division NC10 bacterium]|nr:A/G-specific adenine glycosylase [candidate division NC10 bacterium]MBI4391565.1 A/G-specific adenine glycosylase [candidate division NC10 bacterium]